MGDLNAKVGDERYQNIVGRHGLGRRNERGETTNTILPGK